MFLKKVKKVHIYYDTFATHLLNKWSRFKSIKIFRSFQFWRQPKFTHTSSLAERKKGISKTHPRN
jgi:hypothetical protein